MKPPKPIKGFDVLAFKRKAQQRIYRATKDMTPKEEIEFYNRRVGKGPKAFQYKVEKIRTPATREKKTRYKAR